jgi:hypothetical protein
MNSIRRGVTGINYRTLVIFGPKPLKGVVKDE